MLGLAVAFAVTPAQTPPAQATPPQTPPAQAETPTPAEALAQSEGVVTYIVPLNYISSTDMLTMVQVFVSGNATVGIRVFGSNGEATIQGNYVGTDVSGTTAVGNGSFGVLMKTNLSSTPNSLKISSWMG